MQRSNRVLWFALAAIILITFIYLLVIYLLKEIPPSSELFGHLIGVFGFILMLMTETLYTIRKRSRTARWGRTSSWLNFHIFTGVVGPYMVLLHSAWDFHGLAGLSLLLTIIIVISGFVGRYIYTAVPRTVDGAEIEVNQLEKHAAEIQIELKDRINLHPELAGLDFTNSRDRRSALSKLDPEGREQVRQFEDLNQRQRLLQAQITSLARMRRLLGLWHTIHIPIGLVLFTTAFIHSFAAFYYATLLR